MMKTKIRQLTISYLITLFMAFPVLASDIAVSTRLETIDTVGEQVRGNVIAQVTNMSGETIRNVDLRLANPGALVVEQGVLQFRQVSNNDVITTTKTFYADQEFIASGEPINWRLDYDDIDGNHQQVIISSDVIQ